MRERPDETDIHITASPQYHFPLIQSPNLKHCLSPSSHPLLGQHRSFICKLGTCFIFPAAGVMVLWRSSFVIYFFTLMMMVELYKQRSRIYFIRLKTITELSFPI